MMVEQGLFYYRGGHKNDLKGGVRGVKGAAIFQKKIIKK